MTVDTTVQPKAITFPTDAKLLHAAIKGLNRLARKCEVRLRQSYPHIAKRAAMMASRYAHAKQFKRHHRQLRLLRSRLGRIIRDIRRKIARRPELAGAFEGPLARAAQIRSQQQRQRGWKLHSFHAPEVECIGKGKASAPYEFGVKASIVTTHACAPGGQFVTHVKALPGNPYDGQAPAFIQLMNIVRASVYSPSPIDSLSQHVFVRILSLFRHSQPLGNESDLVLANAKRYPLVKVSKEFKTVKSTCYRSPYNPTKGALGTQRNEGTSSIPGDYLSLEYRLMNTPDQDTLVRAIVDARFILSEHVGFGSRNSAQALERLRAILDRAELIHALNRMNRKPVALLETGSWPTKNKFKRPTPPSPRPLGSSSASSKSMWGRWENVAPAYVIESALLELCTELSVLAPEIKSVAGPATVKLLDALAAYRDSELTSAGAVPQRDRWVVPFRRRG